jgi:hypothetical protein
MKKVAFTFVVPMVLCLLLLLSSTNLGGMVIKASSQQTSSPLPSPLLQHNEWAERN